MSARIARTLFSGLSIILIVVAVGLYINSRHTKSVISQNILNQLDFRVLLPSVKPSPIWKLETDSPKIAIKDKGDKVFSFIVANNAIRVTVSEQAYPEALIYDNLVNGINLYDEVGSEYGKVSLGRPKDNGGSQTAVLKFGDDALIFARPSQDLNAEQWRLFFNSLKPSS